MGIHVVVVHATQIWSINVMIIRSTFYQNQFINSGVIAR
jgi:hypothetical protein